MRHQGKRYTKAERYAILQSVRKYTRLGYSLRKACILSKIRYETVWRWVDKDDALAIELDALRNEVNASARASLINKMLGVRGENGDWILEPDPGLLKWWLERQEREEFATLTEQKVDLQSEISIPKIEKKIDEIRRSLQKNTTD